MIAGPWARRGRRKRLGARDRRGEADDRPVIVGAGPGRHGAEAGIGGVGLERHPVGTRRLRPEEALLRAPAAAVKKVWAAVSTRSLARNSAPEATTGCAPKQATWPETCADAGDLRWRQAELRPERGKRPAIVGADDVGGGGRADAGPPPASQWLQQWLSSVDRIAVFIVMAGGPSRPCHVCLLPAQLREALGSPGHSRGDDVGREEPHPNAHARRGPWPWRPRPRGCAAGR